MPISDYAKLLIMPSHWSFPITESAAKGDTTLHSFIYLNITIEQMQVLLTQQHFALNTPYHCPALNMKSLAATFKVRSFTVSDASEIEITSASETDWKTQYKDLL